MARSEPMVNQIADALVLKLKEIGTDQTAWLTEPATVQRGLPPEGLKFPMPALFVTVGSITPVSAMNETWIDQAEIAVACITQDPTEPETELYRLVADVRRCIRTNDLLANEAGTKLVRWLRESDVPADSAARPSGYGVAAVLAIAEYATTREQP